MPAVCVCGCGLDVAAGALCLDWAAYGMKRECLTDLRYSNTLAGGAPEWSILRDQIIAWTNQTCRTHRAVARLLVPYVRIKTGAGNRWEVRGQLDGTLTGVVPFDLERAPELLWTSNWATGLPVGTDQETQTPGSTKREYVVPPGATVTVQARLLVQTPAYVNQPQNLLEIGPPTLSLSAWPSAADTGAGLTC